MFVVYPADSVVDASWEVPAAYRHRPSAQTVANNPSSAINLASSSSPRASPSPSPASTSQLYRRSVTPLVPKGASAKGYAMATGDLSFRDLGSPHINQYLQEHNALTFKLIKTAADFTQKLSSIHEQHAEQLQLLVENFRKRNAELRRERPPYPNSLFTTWEVLLQEIEVDSQVHGDIARSMGRTVGVMLLEKTFHRKIQSRKIFLQRESFEKILGKAEELLTKCHQDYTEAYHRLMTLRNHQQLAEYYDMHNAYVQQLHATNGMLDHYYSLTLPRLLEELEEVYLDLSDVMTTSILSTAELLSTKAKEQAEHYDYITSTCQASNSRVDLNHFLKSLPMDRLTMPPTKHSFSQPQTDIDDYQSEPVHLLKDELVIDRLSQLSLPSKSDSLRQDVVNLESQIRQLHEALDALLRLQQRSLESSLYNKSNELQEDISMKRFDLQVAHIHLAAVRAQLELFEGREAGNGEESAAHSRERKPSTASTTSIKSKWLKAFRSLKTPGESASSKGSDKSDNGDKKSQKSKSDSNPSTPSLEMGQHIFQEYTYKKVTACDACREILRGHVRQGLKCKMCKLNVHSDCQEKVGKCQPKPRLLRRQKSTSEIEAKYTVPETEEERGREVDPIYQLLKQAGDLGGRSSQRGGSERGGESGGRERGASRAEAADRGERETSISSSVSSLQLQSRRPRSNASSSTSSVSSHTLTVGAYPHHSSSSAPHSPQRKKLSLRMKSFSLDSPESSEHVHRRRHQQQGQPNSSSHSQSPQSPVQSRRQFLSTTKAVRMSSVDLPDENEKSLSSASTSPCPSPKPHRLLPTNLYVVLYNFRNRHQDELDLKAGYTVTVIDTSDPDWWQGKCLGKIGFFPSKYVTKLHPGERPLQVTHTIQVSDGENGVKLLRDQIVIQVGEENEGMVTVRTGTSDKRFSCPLKYLQEV